MKNIAIAAFAASLLLASSSAMAKGPASSGASDRANENACFGIGRADYNSNNGGAGDIISSRAQAEATDGVSPNLNVQLNREYRELAQGFCAEGGN